MNVLVNSITGLPCWFIPVVFTRTMPTLGRDFDSLAKEYGEREGK